MTIVTIFWFFFLAGITAAFLAIWGNKKWYWLAGLCFYIFSFLGSWSIGSYFLSVTFILWILAIGHSLKLIKKPTHTIFAILLGLVLWAIMIYAFDDVWWFFPFTLIS